jgi:hypothetical protein
VAPESIAEAQVARDFRAASGQDVDVDIQLGCPHHPMLMPVGLADAQHVAGAQECRKIRGLVAGVLHDDQHIDDGLGGKPPHRGRTDVLNRQCLVRQGAREDCRVLLERGRPSRVVVRDDDVSLLDAPDQDVVSHPFRPGDLR